MGWDMALLSRLPLLSRQGELEGGYGSHADEDAILASTLIRHALRPPPIRALTVSMIQSPLGGLLMPPIGFPALLAAHLLPTAHTAIAMASVATATDPKQCTAACSAARAEAENNQRIGHSPVPAELDNSPGS